MDRNGEYINWKWFFMNENNNISYEEILSIQRKANIVDIIKDYVPLTQKGKNYFGVCPFHDDHSPSMSVSEEKQMYKCFVCGNAGNVFNFIMEFENVSFPMAVKIVADKIGVSIDIKNNTKKITNTYSKLYDIYDVAYKFYQNNLNTTYGKEAKKYLNDRQIDDSMIKTFNIGLSLSESELYNVLKSKCFSDKEIIDSAVAVERGNNIYDLYKNRIMFPLYDLEGKVVGFSGRIYFKSEESKYINTKETDIFKKGELLYNYHIAKREARKEKTIIIVEGFMDVIRLSSIGITNVVATMGTAVTKYQASLIKKLALNIIVMFDGDDAGGKATDAFLEHFDDETNIKIVRLEDNLDPDEYILTKGKDKMLYHLSHPMSAYDYKLSNYKKNIDFSNSKDVSNYVNIMIKEIEKIDDEIIRSLEIKKLSDQTGVDIDIIKSKINTNNNKEINIDKFKKDDIKTSKYEKASKFILYKMLNDNSAILNYYNNLSYLPFENDKKLANEIVMFYKKYNSFNLNDFIVYLNDKKDLINLAVDIDGLDLKEKIDNDIDDCFKTIKEYLYNNQIKKLTNELKTETNEIKRKEIAQKIVELKMKESKI